MLEEGGRGGVSTNVLKGVRGCWLVGRVGKTKFDTIEPCRIWEIHQSRRQHPPATPIWREVKEGRKEREWKGFPSISSTRQHFTSRLGTHAKDELGTLTFSPSVLPLPSFALFRH